MTEEVKAETTAEEQVDVEEAPEPTIVDETIEETPPAETTPKDEPIDYKALAEAESKRAKDAEEAAADLAFKLREAKREEKETPEETEDPNKPLTRAELNDVLKEFTQTNQKSTEDKEAKNIIAKYTQGEEAEAAYLYWKNRVVPTGNLEEDIMFALGGLNHSRVIAQNEELKRSLTSKETKGKDAAGTHKDPTGSSETISSQDAQTIKAAGMKWDGRKRVYSKKLKDGKTFYFDPKTRKRWKGE